jgi:hypothetical protein
MFGHTQVCQKNNLNIFIDINYYKLMETGTQIIYFPPHVKFGNEANPATEFGFIYGKTWDGEMLPCRYWSNLFPNELRNKANSELTPVHRIKLKNTRNQQLVWKEIRKLNEQSKNIV